jgi:hypothetical protein
MASGKSLELAQIRRQPSALCICGAPWSSHLRKDGKGILAKFANEKHMPKNLGMPTYNRKQRRAMGRYRGE